MMMKKQWGSIARPPPNLRNGRMLSRREECLSKNCRGWRRRNTIGGNFKVKLVLLIGSTSS